jgi:hypothetical protein
MVSPVNAILKEKRKGSNIVFKAKAAAMLK